MLSVPSGAEKKHRWNRDTKLRTIKFDSLTVTLRVVCSPPMRLLGWIAQPLFLEFLVGWRSSAEFNGFGWSRATMHVLRL